MSDVQSSILQYIESRQRWQSLGIKARREAVCTSFIFLYLWRQMNSLEVQHLSSLCRDARYEDYMDEDDMDQLVEEWLDVVDEVCQLVSTLLSLKLMLSL